MRQIVRRVLQSLLLTLFITFTTAYSCAQQGPTNPQNNLSWTNPSGQANSSNCVYRCTGSGCTPAPPAINQNGSSCSASAITSYTDSTVSPSTTYGYAVTVKVGTAESGYSNVVSIVVPANPTAPSGLNGTVVGKNEGVKDDSVVAENDLEVVKKLAVKLSWRQPK